MATRSTLVSQTVKAAPQQVYQAFLDAEALATWLAPDGMRGTVERLEPHTGGTFRMSLTYLHPEEAPPGKTADNTDTFEGQFIRLIPFEQIVWRVTFESDQPEFAGVMTITWSLVEKDGATEVSVLFEDIPTGIRLEDNEEGSRQSLAKLAAFVERM